MSNKYQSGKIYKIVDVGYTKCYIGSTCEGLSQRMARHRSNYKLYQCGNQRQSSAYMLFEEFGFENCKIELLECFSCSSKEELEQREGHYIKNNVCVNKVVPCRTAKELYEDTHERQLERFKTYYANKKSEIQQRKSEPVSCECGSVITRGQMSKHIKTKKHCQILQQPVIQQELYDCPCGSSIRKPDKKRHEKSQKHLDWLKQQQQQEEAEQEVEQID